VPRIRAALLAAAIGFASCSGPLVRPAATPSRPSRDALLILPGFGYGRSDGRIFRSVAAVAAPRGLDVYVAPFVTRGGLDSSRDKLRRFVREQRLERYERVHVFAFIAGAWTLNPMAEELPNLATVVYDRSPFQERAPRIAVAELPLLAWLRYGSTIFDVARTPYPPLERPGVRVGVLVETKPTDFMRGRARQADAYGPFRFGCDAMRQRSDDCAYVALNHDEMYERFAGLWPDLESFIRTGAFGEAAVRTAPAHETLAEARR
jgi:hypothetical protein